MSAKSFVQKARTFFDNKKRKLMFPFFIIDMNVNKHPFPDQFLLSMLRYRLSSWPNYRILVVPTT